MTDMSLEELKSAILQGLKEVQERFDRDPRPTDGSVRAEQEARRRLRLARKVPRVGRTSAKVDQLGEITPSPGSG